MWYFTSTVYQNLTSDFVDSFVDFMEKKLSPWLGDVLIIFRKVMKSQSFEFEVGDVILKNMLFYEERTLY